MKFLNKVWLEVKSFLIFIWWSIKVELNSDNRWRATPFKIKIEYLERYATLTFLENDNGRDTSYIDQLENTISKLYPKDIQTLEDVESLYGFEDFSWFYDKLCYEERIKTQQYKY